MICLINGTETCGIIREFDVVSHELLIERGRVVLSNGTLSPDSGWYYIPSGTGIPSMRTIEGK